MNPPTDFTVSRRRFLRQAATGAVAAGLPLVIPATALGRGDAPAPSNTIALGCIGVGSRGEGILRTFLGIPDARVVAVCDPYADRRRKAKEIADNHNGDHGCALYGDYRELLVRRDIDAVVIATQDHWHALIATAAAQAGKDLYCEKPLGVSVEECQAIRAAVRQHRRVFQTGTQQRSERNFRFACELARNGYAGKIHTVQVAAPGPVYRPSYKGSEDPQPVPDGFDWDQWLGPAPRKPYNPGRVAWPDWYLIWDYCAGFVVNWGVHHLDIALWGCPQLAEARFELEAEATYRSEGFTDNVNGWRSTFTYASGLRLVYTDEGQQDIGCRFVGDRGWVRVDRSGLWAEPGSLLETKLKPEDVPLHKSDHHGRDFLASVRSRRDPVSDVDAGHRASCFGMLVDIAARLQRKLSWDPVQEAFVGAADAAALLRRPMQAPWKL